MRYYSTPNSKGYGILTKPSIPQRNDVRLIIKNASESDIHMYGSSLTLSDVYPCSLAAGQSMQIASSFFRQFISCRANEDFVLDVYRLMDNGEELPCSWDGNIDEYVNSEDYTGLANPVYLNNYYMQEVALFDSLSIGDLAILYCELISLEYFGGGSILKLSFSDGYFEVSQDDTTKKVTVSLYNNATKSYSWQQEFDRISSGSKILIGLTGCIIDGVYYKKTKPTDIHITGTVRLDSACGLQSVYFGSDNINLATFEKFTNGIVDRSFYCSKQDVTTEYNRLLFGSVPISINAFEAGLQSKSNVSFKHNYHFNELKWVESATTKIVITADVYYGGWPVSGYITDIIIVANGSSSFVPTLSLINSQAGTSYGTLTADKTYSTGAYKIYVYSNVVLGLTSMDTETMLDTGANSVTITPTGSITESLRVYTNMRRM